ncbi:hypothetical protein [Snuella lapsa]|uniref:Uncharacterized protein n=1 Tax=Snuella lapsa TaxID=870481 RepID=A0ABP6XMS3_9FLAO
MKDLILLGKGFALLSFIMGTSLLSLYLYFDKSSTISSIGFYFVIAAFLINSLLFIINVVGILTSPKHQLELIKTCGIMLLNVPVAILYLYIVISIEVPSNF